MWDEDKKKWINQDGEEEVTAPPPPPPKSALGGPGAPPLTLTRSGQRSKCCTPVFLVSMLTIAYPTYDNF